MKHCNQCGKCCIKYGDGALSATQEEIDLWEIFNPDIFKFVKNNDIWFDPESGSKLTRCPFLEVSPQKSTSDGAVLGTVAQTVHTCSIYLNRPEDCRHYPSRVQEMIRDECEMIEAIDLEHPEQAQKKLDRLMSDSRPPST